MPSADLTELLDRLAAAFGGAEDVTPDGVDTPHVRLPGLELPEPWQPSPATGLTIWEGWPLTRPQFLISEAVLGESDEPPRSSEPVYLVGEAWRRFSFAFEWAGEDPVLAVQRWLSRFTVGRS